MRRVFFSLLAFSLLSISGVCAQTPGSAGVQPQAVYVGPVAPGRVVDVLREAKPQLEVQNCCTYSLGHLVSRYHQGQVEIGFLGVFEGKEWYRVVYGGGSGVIVLIGNDF